MTYDRVTVTGRLYRRMLFVTNRSYLNPAANLLLIRLEAKLFDGARYLTADRVTRINVSLGF